MYFYWLKLWNTTLKSRKVSNFIAIANSNQNLNNIKIRLKRAAKIEIWLKYTIVKTLK